MRTLTCDETLRVRLPAALMQAVSVVAAKQMEPASTFIRPVRLAVVLQYAAVRQYGADLSDHQHPRTDSSPQR